MSAAETIEQPALKAPFPWFGGKSRVASIVWARFGDVANYVEPFFGSGAVLLGRPTAPGVETVNDLDCYLANFWRAIQSDPDTVAQWADKPVNEADLLARHRWLCAQEDFRERMKSDPHAFDAKIAGWWVWGLCSWIGQGWCQAGQRGYGHQPQQIPHLGDAGMGINRKLPHLGNAGRGDYIRETFAALAVRLRNVRVACGDWTRVLGPSVTERHGITGVFLDPPYAEGSMNYSAGGNDDAELFGAVLAWATENGSNPALRIALCGYESGTPMPKGWECVPWKAAGGYGSQGDGAGRANSARERIWFSPHCLKPYRESQLALPGLEEE